VADVKKIDPFDVEALEKSLNDSATRVSTIWISFLIFSLYLLTAATTVTHRQLFLAEPVKLPVLNIELPLWGFFFLAPILFVIFHAYVLLQVLLLARTAAAYNDALDKAVKPPPSNAAMRQRLANTLFAQIFAGSPRERQGWLGWLLKAMAWITLAIAPILILLAFQFSFLAYHSHIATWMHRLLVLIELFAFFLIWPLALDARKDFQWPSVWLNFKRTAVIPSQLFGAKHERRDGLTSLNQSAVSLAACSLFVLLSLSFGTFPGEPHVNLFTGHSLSSVQCDRWLSKEYDRLNIRGVEVLDSAKLAIIEGAPARELFPSEGPRTLSLQKRNFNCGIFDNVNLRRADFSRSTMIGASFIEAELEAASFDEAQLNKSSFLGAKMQRASFRQTNLRGASLVYASGHGARFDGTKFQGSSLDNASLVGTSLSSAQLQGASLQSADLRGAFFVSTALTGADLSDALLQGAMFSETQLQGANLEGAKTDLAVFEHALLWKTTGQECMEARVIAPVHDRIVGFDIDGGPFFGEKSQMAELTVTTIGQLIAAATEDVLPERKAPIIRRLQMLAPEESKGDDGESSMKTWEACEARSSDSTEREFFLKHSDLMRQTACDAVFDWKPIIEGIIENWIFDMHDPPDREDYLGRALLGMDGHECRSSKYVNDFLRERVRARLQPDQKLESRKP
jgi:uncharacterized protein YjbI with pentapeptide repeats